jgi:hypothetical protein
MVKKYLSVSLSIFVLVGAILGTILWTRAFYHSVENYQSPLGEVNLPPQPSNLPKTARVVVVLISGLGDEAAQTLNLPTLSQLAQTGARTVIQSLPPTYAQAAQITLVTGALAETNGAPPIDQSIENLEPTPIDTIFSRAHEAKQRTALLGNITWQAMIPQAQVDETFFVDGVGPGADQAVFEAALSLLTRDDVDLILIQFTQLDFAAKHQGGVESPEYQSAARVVDSYLEQISQVINTGNTALFILGDYGHLASGGNGGTELEITRQPLVIVGSSVAPGNYSDVQQTDIGPTITTLLGVAPPTASQGRILFEMLRLAQQEQAAAQLLLAQQRVGLAQAYLSRIQEPPATLPESLTTDLSHAQNAFTEKNISGALQLSLLAQEVADQHMSLARQAQIRSKQWPRLFTALPVLLVWFITMWRRRGSYISSIVLSALLTISLYHVLYQLQGYDYSISYFNNLTELPFDIARRTVVCLLAGGGLVLIFLMLVNEKNWLISLGTGYGFSVLVTFIFALPLFWAFWQNGWALDWYLPAIETVFWQVTSSFEVMIAAIVGLLLPWPIMLLNVFVNLVRSYLDETKSSELSGLRL